MKCPFCDEPDSEVVESRAVSPENAIRRRRECTKCHKRFTTFEKIKETVLWVIKKDGKREPFDKEKIKRGILRAIVKRPVSLELVDEVVNDIERELLRGEEQEIPSKKIGGLVQGRLKKIDRVAWLRFASVYLEFEDLSDFEKAIEK